MWSDGLGAGCVEAFGCHAGSAVMNSVSSAAHMFPASRASSEPALEVGDERSLRLRSPLFGVGDQGVLQGLVAPSDETEEFGLAAEPFAGEFGGCASVLEGYPIPGCSPPARVDEYCRGPCRVTAPEASGRGRCAVARAYNVPSAEEPGGGRGGARHRWHGSPPSPSKTCDGCGHDARRRLLRAFSGWTPSGGPQPDSAPTVGVPSSGPHRSSWAVRTRLFCDGVPCGFCRQVMSTSRPGVSAQTSPRCARSGFEMTSVPVTR